jgi:hypothetical protein
MCHAFKTALYLCCWLPITLASRGMALLLIDTAARIDLGLGDRGVYAVFIL